MCPNLCSVSVQQMSRLAVACWFWQTEYIQSNYSAVFSSYVTTITIRGRTNIKPQDPREPKEPFGLVPLLLFHIPPPLFLFLGLTPSSSLLFPRSLFSASPLPFFTTLSSNPFSLHSFLFLSSPSLSSVCCYSSTPVSLSVSLFGLPSQQSLPQNPRFYPKPPTLGLFILSFSMVDPSSCSDSHAPRDTFQKCN